MSGVLVLLLILALVVAFLLWKNYEESEPELRKTSTKYKEVCSLMHDIKPGSECSNTVCSGTAYCKTFEKEISKDIPEADCEDACIELEQRISDEGRTDLSVCDLDFCAQMDIYRDLCVDCSISDPDQCGTAGDIRAAISVAGCDDYSDTGECYEACVEIQTRFGDAELCESTYCYYHDSYNESTCQQCSIDDTANCDNASALGALIDGDSRCDPTENNSICNDACQDMVTLHTNGGGTVEQTCTFSDYCARVPNKDTCFPCELSALENCGTSSDIVELIEEQCHEDGVLEPLHGGKFNCRSGISGIRYDIYWTYLYSGGNYPTSVADLGFISAETPINVNGSEINDILDLYIGFVYTDSDGKLEAAVGAEDWGDLVSTCSTSNYINDVETILPTTVTTNYYTDPGMTYVPEMHETDALLVSIGLLYITQDPSYPCASLGVYEKAKYNGTELNAGVLIFLAGYSKVTYEGEIWYVYATVPVFLFRSLQDKGNFMNSIDFEDLIDMEIDGWKGYPQPGVLDQETKNKDKNFRKTVQQNQDSINKVLEGMKKKFHNTDQMKEALKKVLSKKKRWRSGFRYQK